MVVGWISMLESFWESSDLTVILPDFHQNCGLSGMSCMSICILSMNAMH